MKTTETHPTISGNRKTEKNFKLSDNAFALVEIVKKNRGNMSDFVSRCIEDYGPVILGSTDVPSKKDVSLIDRLQYLEETVTSLAYDTLVDDWEWEKIRKHQQILKETKRKSWNDKKKIKALIKAARDDAETSDTKKHQWQTLLLRRKSFLDLNEED